MNTTIDFLPYFFPVYFVSIWCFALWILSLSSGWRKLAARYHYPQEFSGEFLRWQSARMNLVNFRSILELGLNESGVYLVPMVLFRPFHKPLFIPWREIIAQPAKKRRYPAYQLQFRSVPGVRLTLYQRTFHIILEYLQKHTGFQLAEENELRR